MRSKQLALDQYDTDKIASHYLESYDPVLEPWIDQEIKLLEIGIHRGGSLKLWRDYFPHGIITGIDIHLPSEFTPGERIYMFEGSQSDIPFLTKVSHQIAQEGFDIIIDDASHIGELTRKSFWHLFDHHLKAGGLFVIEDWGTGYWNDWPDGRSFHARPSLLQKLWHKLALRYNSFSKLPVKIPFNCHSYGMVGFVKELVDEQGASDLTKRSLKGKPERQSKFDYLLVRSSLVFIKKAFNTSI